MERYKRELTDTIERVHKHFKERGLTLSVAESCTGGLVSHCLTMLPGASSFFMAGLVTYSNESKKSLLGIPPATIAGYGVVSEEVARAMAERVRLVMRTDFGLSTTGNLGPDVLEQKERGLVYLAVSREGATVSRELRLKGDRTANKEETALAALELLAKTIEQAASNDAVRR